MLTDLLTNFHTLTPETQITFFFPYYERRNIDLVTPKEVKKVRAKSTAVKGKKPKLIKVSLEQLTQLKKLGLVK